MSGWRVLGAAVGLSAALSAGAAAAEERGVLVISPGELGQPDGSVALLDLGSVSRAGDVVNAALAIVLLDPEGAQAPGVSYMLGHQRLSCRDRTTQMVRVEVFGEAGARLTEFDRSDPAEPVSEQGPWARILNQACQNAPVAPPGAAAFDDMASGVAAVRASAEAATAVQSTYAPHRFVYVGQDARPGEAPASVFVDQAQIEREGEAAVRWVMFAHSRPRTETAAPVAYDLVQLTFACDSRRARVRVRLSYGTDNTLLRQSVVLGNWVDVRAGSIQAAELRAACEASPANAPSFSSTASALEHARSVGGAV
jgi:hypothetical protein